MQIYNFKDKPHPNIPSTVALGLFDGVHLAHQTLLQKTVETAKEEKTKPAVFWLSNTFHKTAARLFSDEDILLSMEKLGIEIVYIADFREISTLSPLAFAKDILLSFCHAKSVLCGFNYTFGYKAEGNADTLLALGQAHGFDVSVLPAICYQGEPVSSSAVRHALRMGQVHKATALLGHPFHLSGTVTHGKGLGRKLSFPTLNIGIPSGFVELSRGVYVTLCKIDNIFYPSVSNIGTRPTVENQAQPNCEVHLLNACGDFYEEKITLYLLDFLRGEQVFESVAKLTEQINQDVSKALTYFQDHKEEIQSFSSLF